MTTFYVGSVTGHAVVAQKSTGMGFWSDDILLCYKHRRGMLLQPFLAADQEAGFGKYGCPFCEGKALEEKYHLYRSKTKLKNVLEEFQEREGLK